VDPSLNTSIYDEVEVKEMKVSINLYSVRTSDGAQHPLVNMGNNAWMTSDGSGFRTDNMLRDGHGHKFNDALAEDANGDQITSSASFWTDSLGRQIPAAPAPAPPDGSPANPSTASLSCCPALNYPNQPVSFAYAWNLPTVNGGTLSLILCYASVYVRTNFFGSLGNGPRFFDVHRSFNMLQSVLFLLLSLCPNGDLDRQCRHNPGTRFSRKACAGTVNLKEGNRGYRFAAAIAYEEILISEDIDLRKQAIILAIYAMPLVKKLGFSNSIIIMDY
jgi:hypothetical protein